METLMVLQIIVIVFFTLLFLAGILSAIEARRFFQSSKQKKAEEYRFLACFYWGLAILFLVIFFTRLY